MSKTLTEVQRWVARGEVGVSQHARGELEADRLSIDEVLAGVQFGEVVEDYPDYFKGPCVLVLQQDSVGSPGHAVWGIRRGSAGPAVLVTVYRPDPGQWSADFRQRKP